MSNSLEDQAIRPRGNTTREKLQFMVNWYEKAAQNDASDKFQRDFLDATGSWVPEGRLLLENADHQLNDAINSHLEKIRDDQNKIELWLKNGMVRQYILIELSRTLVP